MTRLLVIIALALPACAGPLETPSSHALGEASSALVEQRGTTTLANAAPGTGTANDSMVGTLPDPERSSGASASGTTPPDELPPRASSIPRSASTPRAMVW